MLRLALSVSSLLVAYGYGIRVGHLAGQSSGRAAADAEWALMLEHGAL